MELKPHQLVPVNFMKKNRGLILFHSTGAGKTITALYAMYQFPNKIIILGPKSSKKAFYDNIQKAGLDKERVKFYTYTKIKEKLLEKTTVFKNKNVILDEAHTIRTETDDNLTIMMALSLANKVLLLTATPVINFFTDLSVLVNIAKNTHILPTNKETFAKTFYDQKSRRMINLDDLKDKMSGCISYYETRNTRDYPTHETKYMPCEFDKKQIAEYAEYVRQIFKNGEDVGTFNIYGYWFHELSGAKKNYFLLVTRQLSNIGIGEKQSPKTVELMKTVAKGPFPIVIYSNFLERGVYFVAGLLKKEGYRYNVITGKTSNGKIVDIVNGYNNGDYDVLLISSAGSESLDLKNTRAIHILEPHWNEARITQVIGRAIRYKSHAALPKEERHVVVYRWYSVFPKGIKNETTDEYLINLSESKEYITEKFSGIIKQVCIENSGRYAREYAKYKGEYKKIKEGN